MATAKSPVYKLNNGIEMPVLGLGVFRSEPEKAESVVTAVVADGYRLIDTLLRLCCMNEQQVEKASALPAKSLAKRSS